ncbi:exodeoxyribonuclease VII large subunit [Vibrio vulnificus]|nr:exodeoxyribonuclease VII large subunit [Vibrio vulnificus]
MYNLPKMEISMILDRKLRLEVPYGEREEAKRLGALPYSSNGAFVCWYVPKGIDVTVFKKWWTPKFQHMLNKQSNKPSSLSVYLGVIKNLMEETFTEGSWLTAEISNITGSSHVYLELSDYDSNGSELAKARGMIWSKRKDIISKFERSTGMKLAHNMKVLICVKPEFSEKYGLSLNIIDINPSFTIGEMEAKLNAIRDRLRSEGIFLNNKRMKAPDNFFRVAVLSPDMAAGLGDFKTQSSLLDSLGLCKFSYYSATFQGNNSINTITSAVSKINADHERNPFDAVCVIRGGGDKAGLYALNEYEIAKSLLCLNAPIFCGIGHERDNTIIDEISHTRCATPSMVVNMIRDIIISSSEKDARNFERIISLSEKSVLLAKTALDGKVSRIIDNSAVVIERARNTLDQKITSISSISKDTLVSADNIRKEKLMMIMMNNPIAILNKGYSLLNQDETLVTSVNDLKEGKAKISLSDGIVRVGINQIEKVREFPRIELSKQD